MSHGTKEHPGLYDKYVVTRTDGGHCVGRKHERCRYFVLDLTHDPAARTAAMLYASIVRPTEVALADDLVSLVEALGGKTAPGAAESGTREGHP